MKSFLAAFALFGILAGRWLLAGLISATWLLYPYRPRY